MKNKKGFTLIELLAVIVILAIIALIAVPMILNVVEKSRKGAAVSSAYGYIDAIEKYTTLHDLDSTRYPYDLKGQTLNVNETNASIENKKLNDVLTVKGEKPKSGTVTIDNKGKVTDATLTIGKYEVSCPNGKCSAGGSSNNTTTDDTTTTEPEPSTPTIADPVSFATDSWEVIINAVQNNNTSSYSVGDEKTIDMGTFGTQTVRIANMSTPTECSTTGFSQTGCGFVVEFKTLITTYNMNSSATNVGGWPATTMRTFVNSDIYNALPSDLKAGIINTTVVSSHGSTSGEGNFTSTDKLYLLDRQEVLGDNSSNNTAYSSTRQIDYYVGKSYRGRLKYLNDGSTEKEWWLRSAYSSGDIFFNTMDDEGDTRNRSALYAGGVSPAFRIG